MTDFISIIIPCRNEGSNVAMTVNSMNGVEGSTPYEIIIVDDGSEDGCCDFLLKEPHPYVRLLQKKGLGAANARNVGAEAARGNVVLFCDAHITVEDNWLDKMMMLLRAPGVDAVCPAMGVIGQPGAVGYGQTWDDQLNVRWAPQPSGVQPVALAPGACLAIKRDAFFDIGGFERGFRTWGFEDSEISLKLWLFNHPIYVHPEVKVLHLFRPSHPYKVTMGEYHYNLLRMALSHLNRDRIAKVMQLVMVNPEAKNFITDLMLTDIWEQRADYFKRRTFDDDWFMERFEIGF